MIKKPTLLLHIGTEKTGTTSIQEFLACNRKQLAQHGILYPTCLGDKNHIKITAYAELAPWPFAGRNLSINTEEKHAHFCLTLEQQLQAELDRQTYHAAIISSEHLHSIIASQEQIRSLKTFLERFFSAIQVIVYFRRQDLMAVSLKSTALLVGHTPTRQLDLSATKSYYYNFNAIYDNWAGVFGSENIKVRAFLREKLVSGNVLTDFCATAGLGDAYGLVMTERKNESLSLEAACLLHELNGRLKDGRLVLAEPLRKRHELIQKITAQFKGEPYYPSRQEGTRFYRACSENNQVLQEKLNMALFDDDFSMYPEQEDAALYEATLLWAKTALDMFDLYSKVGKPTANTAKNASKPLKAQSRQPLATSRPGKHIKIGIIANCQANPLAKALATIDDVASVVTVPIHLYGNKNFTHHDDNFKQLLQDPDAIVLSYVNGPNFGDYATAVLKQHIAHFYTLTNIHFSGLHPDITYVGDQGGRISSCLGDYHSKIILHSFLNGLSTADCQARFCGQEYEKLGFYQEFANSATALRSRDEQLDITFAEPFLDLLAKVPCLYTTNHPTATVFQEFTLHIAHYFGLKTWRQPPELLVNHLANGVWWPVYDEIAETHGLQYRTPMIFRQAENRGGKDMALATFIETSYQQYATQHARLNNSRQIIELLAAFPH